MANVAVLVPHWEMRELARPIIGQYEHINPMCIEYTQTENIQARARELEMSGCELIVARGLQAKLIKQSVKLPVVEICVTMQELGMLILKLKKVVGGERPKIGLIGVDNMLCDTSQFDTLFHIELVRYMVENKEQMGAAVERATAESCVAVIGGEIVCERARIMGLPHCFIPSGLESIRAAFDTAARICYAIDLEKSNSAEMNTMLDFTFSGIMQIDAAGMVQRANRVTFNLLNKRPNEMLNRHVLEVLPQLSERQLERVLTDGEEIYAILLPIQKKETIVNIAPITIDGQVTGAILTFQEGARITEMDSELRRELYQRGLVAKYNFDKLIQVDDEPQSHTVMAKRVARYNAPILISGEAGCGKRILAQCIHNESMLRRNAFVSVDCSVYHEDVLDTMLFGNYTSRKDTRDCMAELARDGTLYLAHVEALSFELQYKLLGLMQGKFLHNGSNQPITCNVRVIASTESNLISCVEEGSFRSDLYYALTVLQIEIPPVRQNRGNILKWVDYCLENWQNRYKRYVHLTNGARKYLQEYNWPGNLHQINCICERIVLMTEQRSVDEVFLLRQMEQMTPRISAETKQVILFKDEKAAEIADLLKKHGGNRQKVADELGVSKTTLWRYMKKYGISSDFSY